MTGCVALLTVLGWDLAASNGGWVSGGTLDQWAHGVPPGASDAVWTTRLGADTLNDTVETLEVTLPDLAGITRPVFVLNHSMDLGVGDTARILVDTGAGFMPIAPIGGYPAGGDSFVDTGVYATGLLATGWPAASRLRFEFAADGAGSGPGWTISALTLYDGDPVPPTVSLVTTPDDTQDLEGGYRVAALVDDDAGPIDVALVYDIGQGPVAIDMGIDGSLRVADLPPFPPDTTVQWRIEASDCSNTTRALGPPFRVFLAAPGAITGPTEPHTVAQEISLAWTPPDSPWPVVDYQLETGTGDLVYQGTTPAARVSIGPDEADQSYVVTARYDTPFGIVAGDSTPPVIFDVEVPELVAIEPARGFAGDQVYVELTGRSVYLLDGLTTVTLLPDVRATATAVRNVDQVRILLSIPRTLEPGAYALEVGGSQGVFRFPEAFEVVDGDLVPAITRVVPPSLTQGDTTSVTFFASARFGPDVTLVVDDDLVVAGTPVVDGDQLTVDLAAIGRARPGVHSLVIDDGLRAYDATMTIDEYRVSSERGCATAGGRGPFGVLLGIALIGMQRRRPNQGRIAAHRE